jgi:nonribosomal peptide synthetase DhbF
MTRLYEAFAAAAFAQPGAPAIVSREGRLTYMQALARVSTLSDELTGAKRNAALIIGTKSADVVLWQLACNKADKVFIPCDDATPAARLADIVTRTRPRWILSNGTRDFVDLGYAETGRVGNLRMWKTADFREYADEVSHIIFSSGSTGAPKAILLPAAPVVAVVREQARMLGIGPGARFAWMLSPSFDASLSDIYSTLLSGAELHICNFSMRSVKTLQAYFKQYGITHSDLSPSLLPLLSPAALPDLRALIFGGELAKESVVFEWVKAGKRLFNAYGPTEATICTSLREVTLGWTATDIGLPLPGVSYVIKEGETLRPGRSGDKGELYIGGRHLAVGYDDAAQTAQRFLSEGGAPYYKSGDVVEVDAQGHYHFKGRVDRQMKHHGVLLCPEEMETQALRAGATEALLQMEDERLVLHYAGDVAEADLKAVLKDNLLTWVLPHRYVQHASLPKNLAGKIQL